MTSHTAGKRPRHDDAEEGSTTRLAAGRQPHRACRAKAHAFALCYEELDRHDKSEALFPNIVRYGWEGLRSLQHGERGVVQQTVSRAFLNMGLYDPATSVQDDME